MSYLISWAKIIGVWCVAGAVFLGFIIYKDQHPTPAPKPVIQTPTAEEAKAARIARATILEQDIVDYAGFQGKVAGNVITCWRDAEVNQLTKRVQNALRAFNATPKQMEMAVAAYNMPLNLGKTIRTTRRTNNRHCEQDIMVLEGSIAEHKLAGF